LIMSKKLPSQTYNDAIKDKLGYDYFRNKLKAKDLQNKNSFNKKFPYVGKYLEKKGLSLETLRAHSAKLLGASALTGTLLLSPPSGIKALPSPKEMLANIQRVKGETPQLPQKLLVDILKDYLPEKAGPLNNTQEKYLEQIFDNLIGVKTRANLEGEHLNTTYGYIGAEQHLRRYPGDTLNNHGSGDTISEGIAPGLGAWGYFAKSKVDLTPQLEETERWYAVVQTLYLPDWNTRQPYLRDWYKYRKVLIVNTKNGNAVVAAIADSGPAAWTGKQFGGSPEVMDYLGGAKYKKGAVVIFFVDDPQNKIPLGPVDYNKIDLPEVSLVEV